MNNADAWCIGKPSERVVLNVLADLRLARNLGGLGNFVLGAGSKLNCLLHTAKRPLVERGSPERPPRVGDRWTCSSNETRMGRAWVVARVDRFISSKGTRDTPTTIIIFRDPDDVEHTCHVGASQLKCDGWAPVPEETLRLMAEVLDFMRTGPADLTGRLERTCRRHVPPVIGEDHKAYEARAAEALVAAGWHIGHSVADAEWALVKPLKAYAQPVSKTTAAGARPDVAEGEYWAAPLAVAVTCPVWRVVRVWRYGDDDGDVIVRMEDPRPDSPAGTHTIEALAMARDGWRRCLSPATQHPEPPKPQVGEVWVGPAGRVWRITGRHGPDIVAETRYDGRMTRAILASSLLTPQWRRATSEEIERVCEGVRDARDWIVVDKTPGPR